MLSSAFIEQLKVCYINLNIRRVLTRERERASEREDMQRGTDQKNFQRNCKENRWKNYLPVAIWYSISGTRSNILLFFFKIILKLFIIFLTDCKDPFACLILNHFDWKITYVSRGKLYKKWSKVNAKNIEFTACQVGWGVWGKCAVYKCVQNLYVLRINLETLMAGACVCV